MTAISGTQRALPAALAPATEGVRLSEVVSALSYALDITEGQTAGHSVRTCLIGMRIAEVIGLGAATRSALFYALLLKDLGCSSNAARLCHLFGADDFSLKRIHKLTDWTDPSASAKYAYRLSLPGRGPLARAWHTVMLGTREKGSGRQMVATRCERGADIAQLLGLDPMTSTAIRALDEHWNGAGLPLGISGEAIPLLGRIAGLAQTVEVFHAAMGLEAAVAVARDRSGTWFDPELVRAFESTVGDTGFWGTLDATDQLDQVSDLEPADRVVLADPTRLDQVARAFALVIDAKSPYTARHSEGVAAIAVSIATELGLSRDDQRTLHRAGLLHDIGKLGVSNTILDKPGRLNDAETGAMRKHTGYSFEIINRVVEFRSFAGIAAAHHERLDGQGYHLGLKGQDLGPLARVLAVADIAEALTAERPYRDALPREQVLQIMRKLSGYAIDPAAFAALETTAAPWQPLPAPSLPATTP